MLGSFVVTDLLSSRVYIVFASSAFRRLVGNFLAVAALFSNLVGQRVDQDKSAEVDAALLLAQRAYWIYLACAMGRYETREQRSGQKDRNHDRKSR